MSNGETQDGLVDEGAPVEDGVPVEEAPPVEDAPVDAPVPVPVPVTTLAPAAVLSVDDIVAKGYGAIMDGLVSFRTGRATVLTSQENLMAAETAASEAVGDASEEARSLLISINRQQENLENLKTTLGLDDSILDG